MKILSIRMKAPVMAILLFCSTFGFSQKDTLHLPYHHTQIAPHDSTVAKIEAWAKKLNGQHVDIEVVAYFHKPEFKKFAQQRCDELFLILNRKARSLITIVFIGPKRGEPSQKTLVDIAYKPTVTPEAAAAEAAKEKAAAEEKKLAEKAAKDSEKKGKAPEDKKKGKADTDDGQVSKDAKDEKGAGKEKKDTKGGKEKDGKEKKGGDKAESDEEDKDVAFSTVATYNEGYVLTLDEVNLIKGSKFIIAETGDKNMDENLQSAVKEFWHFTSDISTMPYKDARKIGKENKKEKIVILSIAQVKTWFVVKSFGYEYRVLKLGRAICLENGSGKTICKQIIPTQKGIGVTKEYMLFGVAFMNNLCRTMFDEKIEKSNKVDYMTVENAEELKSRPLLIAESMMHPKFPPEDISKYYSGKVSIVPDQEWKNTILERKDALFVLIVKQPTTAGTHFHYIMNAKTGKVFLYDEGPSVQMAVNIGVPKNLAPSQSGYVDKANFERYQEAMRDAADKAAKKQEKKEKAEAKKKDSGEKAEKDADDKKEKAEKKEKDAAAKKEKEAADKAAKEKEKEQKAKEKEDAKKKKDEEKK